MCRGARTRQDDWEKYKMNCEEFEAIGLSIERDAAADAAERAAAEEHASTCLRCAALQQSWLVAKLELSALSEATRAAETPERVELRLRHELRTRNRTMPARPAAATPAQSSNQYSCRREPPSFNHRRAPRWQRPVSRPSLFAPRPL